MNVREDIQNLITEAVKNLQKKGAFSVSELPGFEMERPEESSFGDYSVNAAMKFSKALGDSPKNIAEKIKKELLETSEDSIFLKVEVAGPGFLNVFLKDEVFLENLRNILKEGDEYGSNETLKGEKIMVEYTDPNPFKVFHIGHLMSNAIGESISRILEFSGAKVKRACYQGDVGMHVAMAVFGILNQEKHPDKKDSLEEKVKFLGSSYALGAKAYKESEEAQRGIKNINKAIFEKENEDVMDIYNIGRKWSLDYFETIYKKLGTKFDYYFFESETGNFGKKVVEKNIKNEIFAESENAVVFLGDKHGLHIRVFINSEGLPTYEAKELGLAKVKYDKYKYDKSVVITGNEVNEYFKVILAAMKLVFPELAEKTEHISHGMLRLPTGKMSSRTGDVFSAEELLQQASERIASKIKEEDSFSEEEKEELIEKVAISAIKYSILKQKTGKDIIFDLDKSISFEGGSGPYLQYTFARATSVLKKAKKEKIKASLDGAADKPEDLERILQKFPETIMLSSFGREPHHIVTYLLTLAQAFNSYYAKNQIVSGSEKDSYRVALTEATTVVLKNGLNLLGISSPEKM